MDAPVIRISIGKFDPAIAEVVEAKLNESRARLEAGVRAMRGHIAYFAGVDRSSHAMHNVSIWRTVADAEQMATFAPMMELGKEFSALGVRFERPILNFDTLWRID
ncbi:MAG: hypothetical protein JOY52_16760 [Hyphomicrobiales bacterium]|nr:hypothetical protein [Hyphomicrobiales bacterium]